jgi:hypothetical protein
MSKELEGNIGENEGLKYERDTKRKSEDEELRYERNYLSTEFQRDLHS